MRHAIIENNKVINVTLWDGETEWTPPEGTIAVSCGDEVGPEWTYDGTNFIAPFVPEPAALVAPTTLNKIDFLRLFTQAERIAIKEAAKINPVVEDYQYMLDSATEISLTDPDILAGIPALEAAEIIGPGRAAQILAGQGV